MKIDEIAEPAQLCYTSRSGRLAAIDLPFGVQRPSLGVIVDSLNERPLRRNWTCRFPDFGRRIEVIFRAQNGCSEGSEKWIFLRSVAWKSAPELPRVHGFISLKMLPDQSHRFSVAPMMEWTDRHCRMFHRILTRRARLYTEMVTVGAVLHGPRERLLGFSPVERPVALQLGGNDPQGLAQAARIGVDFGYDEINLNVGCPSDRVQGGAFGACLMRAPMLVGACVAAMKAVVRVPVTVKCRIGVDEQDPEAALDELAEATLAAGVDGLIVHARKAWLQGLSPKENRDVPPLDYTRVRRLKATYPMLPIAINGGIATLEEAQAHLMHVDGVMLGRAAYRNPEVLLAVDPCLFGEAAPVRDGFAAIEAFIPYVAGRLAGGERLQAMTRHLLGLFAGQPGARAWRRHLATQATRPGAGIDTLRAAMDHLRQPALAA